MVKLKLSDKEANLLWWILSKQLDYGWDSCLGGHQETDKRAVAKYNKEMKIVGELAQRIITKN